MKAYHFRSNMNIKETQKAIHKNAIIKGFWDKDQQFGTLLMLVVSELGECLEADRNDHHADIKLLDNLLENGGKFPEAFKIAIKDTVEDEIADTIIRLLDLAEKNNIDIEKHIELKMRYNAGRERLHGKNY